MIIENTNNSKKKVKKIKQIIVQIIIVIKYGEWKIFRMVIFKQHIQAGVFHRPNVNYSNL